MLSILLALAVSAAVAQEAVAPSLRGFPVLIIVDWLQATSS
jgi:hypothetical protein